MKVSGKPHAPAALPPIKVLLSLYRKLYEPRVILDVWKNFEITGFRYPDHPARSVPLYR